MHEFPLITDSDLARAREDAEFRQRLLTQSLERLLKKLSKLQRDANNAQPTDQVREGVELAVKLADLLRRIAAGTTRAA
jgi:N-glycosylase/DNA lyase